MTHRDQDFASLLDLHLTQRGESRKVNTLNYLVLCNIIPRPCRISHSVSLLSTDEQRIKDKQIQVGF